MTRKTFAAQNGRRLACASLVLLPLLLGTSASAAPAVDDRDPTWEPPTDGRPGTTPTLEGRTDGRVSANTALLSLPPGTEVVFTASGFIRGMLRGRVAAVNLEGNWAFQVLEKPRFSQATFADAVKPAEAPFMQGAIYKKIVTDAPGRYRVRATACPGGCDFMREAARVKAPQQTFDFELSVLDMVGPHSHVSLPKLPVKPKVDQDVYYKCGLYKLGGAGWINPQWVTSEKFEGPRSYRLLEGYVDEVLPGEKPFYRDSYYNYETGNGFSDTENFLNHSSYDWHIPVLPDPEYHDLLPYNSGHYKMDIEWESRHMPAFIRPSVGDRVSAVGYHIFDCGHGGRSEIHPPVLFAVHPPRPILIPEAARIDFGKSIDSVGKNVYVPGVVSDVYATTQAGSITGSALNPVALHSPHDVACVKDNLWRAAPGIAAIQGGLCRGDSINNTSIKRVFEYKIHLPQNPRAVASDKGMNVADALPAPLYVSVEPIPGFGSGWAPKFKLQHGVGEDGKEVWYLDVKIDLTAYPGDQYAYRIVAGWVYPEPSNFGLERFQVAGDTVHVLNDLDLSFMKGEWSLFANVNSMTNTSFMSSSPNWGEWARIVRGSVKTGWTLGPTHDVRDDSTAPQGIFRDNVFAFPGQKIVLTAHGYDDDPLFLGDGLGEAKIVLKNRPTGMIATKSYRGHYRLDWRLSNGAPIPRALLSGAAQEFMRPYYKMTTSVHAPIAVVDDTPLSMAFKTSPTLPPEDEPEVRGLLGEISDAELAEYLQKASAGSPELLDTILGNLRAAINEKITPDRLPALLVRLETIRAAVPTAAWTKHFGDLK